MFITLLLYVGVFVLSELLRPKPKIENQRPAGLGDFQIPTATEGRVVPLIWGRVRQRGPNVVWFGDLLHEPIIEKVKTGLFSSERFVSGYKYNLGLQFALCRGPNVVLKKVWIGDEEVFSGIVSTNTTFDIDEPELDGGGIQTTCDFYIGSVDQPVNAYLNTADRQQISTAITPTAPRYKGTCHIVARQLTSAAASATDRGAFLGNSTSIRAWSFELERYPALFSGQSAGENKVGVDANPANVIYEILTNKEWGFGVSSSTIDLVNLLSVADTLITESNGFSLLLDREMPARDMLQELGRQIDGAIFVSHVTGKWTVKLARADYDIDTIPQLTDDNVTEVRDYTRGSWEDTTNTISVEYDKRDDDYKLSYALAQDMANAMIQGDGTVTNAQSTVGKVAFPGVKSSALASNLAWRELRTQSYPLARCTLVVNRRIWSLSIGSVIAWSNVERGFNRLPMRITRINYGRLEDNKMSVTVVQDVFKFAAASMGTPNPTGWTPPTSTLAAFPSTEQLAIEAPRGIFVRDPEYGGDISVAKILCAARRQSNEVIFDITERHSSGTPSGTFADSGSVYSFTKIGELSADLAAGTAIPTSTITVTPTPDSQTDIEAAFDDSATDSDLGVGLAQLIMVNNEFMLVQNAADSGGNVDLQGVYRGVLDSAQASHSAGDSVFLLHVGAGLTDTTFVNTHNVDIQLRMRSFFDRFSGTVTTIPVALSKRNLRPYPPSCTLYNGGSTPYGTPDLEDQGSTENDRNFRLDWRRRRFDTTDEVAEMLANQTVDASTEYQVRVFVDPDGVNTEIASSPFAWSASSITVPRNEILEIAEAGTPIYISIQARHDILAETNLTSRNNLIHEVIPDTVNNGLFYLGGGLRASDVSNTYAAVASGTFTVRIGAAYATSNVQYRLNGGSWTTVIASGGTSGTILGVVPTDTIEVRHTVNETPSPQFISIDNPSAVRVAYGTLSN